MHMELKWFWETSTEKKTVIQATYLTPSFIPPCPEGENTQMHTSHKQGASRAVPRMTQMTQLSGLSHQGLQDQFNTVPPIQNPVLRLTDSYSKRYLRV